MPSHPDLGMPITDGESNLSIPRDIVTGNSAEAAEKTEKPDTSESGKSPKDSILPKWLDTNPEILAGQLKDLLALMQKVKWFVYVTPITSKTGRVALRIVIAPPKPHTIGVSGTLADQIILVDGKPVTE